MSTVKPTKAVKTEQTDIELAVQEGERRYRERVLAVVQEAGSVRRAAQFLRMGEADIQAIVDKS